MITDEKILAEVIIKPILNNLSLGESFRHFRESEEINISELAKRLSVSKQFLSDVELGKKQVGIQFIEKFAKELGYGIEPFIRIFLRDQLKRAGLDYDIRLEKKVS